MTVQTTNTDSLTQKQKILREQHVVAGHHYFNKVHGVFTCDCGQMADAYGKLIDP